MRCSTCQASAPDGSRFCPACGRPLTDFAGVTNLPDAGETMAGDASTGSLPAASDALFEPGTLLADRYRIVRLLGRGGMGVVYQADDRRLDHRVALKFLPPALAGDARRLAQFHNEVSVARQVSHPNVCRVYDIGDIDGHLFLSMEFVEGEDLAARLDRHGPFAENEGVELTRQICAGLAAVHARGVLHRDLKPANIMLNQSGSAQLMDFGIAAAGDVEDADRITEGTPAYMAPEQLARAEASVQSDIYALGLVMYEIFAGRRLFNPKTLDELRREQGEARSTVATALDARVSVRVRDTILQCLDPDPARRQASASAVSSMLQTVLLDARTTWRRIGQVVNQLVAVPLLFVGGMAVLGKTGQLTPMMGVLLLCAGLVLIAVELLYPLGWTVSYKGHRVRFWNHPVFGERLYIDDVLADRGGVGLNMTMRGTIERGAGAGERITAKVQCRIVSVAVHIVAESFAPGT